MDLQKLYEIPFDTEESIVSASFSASDRLVILMSSGRIFTYNISTQSLYHLFSIPLGTESIHYRDGGFDIHSSCSIYTMDDNVVVVNDYKTHGYLYTYDKKKIHLWRKDYYAEHSRYPIALLKNGDTPLIIYSTEWNRLHVMNIETLQVLTATKSLIHINAESDHKRIVEMYPEKNHQPWPVEYNYFYGGLLLSPDKKRFLSKGWVWGSADAYYVYDIQDFIHNNRISDKVIGLWEHVGRAACWIDNNTVAILYDPKVDGDDTAANNSKIELHFYDVNQSNPEIIKRIKLPVFESPEPYLYFYPNGNCLVAFGGKGGLLVCTTGGEIIMVDGTFKPDTFYSEYGLFLTINDRSIIIHSLS
jgi:hypothetical protein